MKVLKITSPLAVGNFAELIMKFYNKAKDGSGMFQGITYESIYIYLTRVVQLGKGTPEDRAEFWVAFDGETAVGFASWRVLDLPHVGKVSCDCIYNDIRNQKAIKGLYEEFINFGKRHRAPLYQLSAVNEKVGQHFVDVGMKLDIELFDTGAKTYVGRKK